MMNERIKAIGRQAGFAFIEDGVYGDRWYSSQCGMNAEEFEKFAELIVRECLTKCDEVQAMYGQYTFTARKCKESIQQHFGVSDER